MSEEIIVDGIHVSLNRKNIKHMYLKIIPPDGSVRVSAPKTLDMAEIVDFIKSREKWILEKQKKIRKMDYQSPVNYNSSETHYLWGREYNLQLITNNNHKKAFIKYNTIYLPVSKKTSFKSREKALNELYRNELKTAVDEIYDKCVNVVGRSPSEIKIRKMKNWGNCNQKGRITLNLNLAKKDKICLEYVFIHELTHLIEFNHGKNFKKLMDEFCPDWREIKKKLNE